MRHRRATGAALLAAGVLLAWPAGGAASGEPDRLREQLEAAWSAGDWPAAEENLKRLHQHYPENAEILRRWGLAAAYQGDYDPALRRLRRAQALSPDNTDILLALARVHAWRGAREQAEAGYHPWFCQACAGRICSTCGAPLRSPVGCTALGTDGSHGPHSPMLGARIPCKNPDCPSRPENR